MSGAVAAISPLREESRKRRFGKLAGWGASVVIVLVLCALLEVDILGWFSDVWEQVTSISIGYVIAGCTFQTVQTTLTAVGWLYILRAAFTDVDIDFRAVLAAYAVGVAMNSFLPANIGTFVMMFIFVALIPGATFPKVFAGFLVQKIFFTMVGALVYVYLFLTVPDMSVSGSNSPDWSWFSDHVGLVIGLAAAAVLLVVLLVRVFWQKLAMLWNNAKQGGAILQRPREYLLKVALPSFGGYVAKLCVIGVFLAAYGIAVTFDSIMHVVGSSSIANTVSFTPGGVGVNQAMNVIALEDYADADTATAYSIGQQLVTTAWNVVFAIALVVWVFGWTGGKTLVRTSYDDAKVKVEEERAARAERRAEKKAAKASAHDNAEAEQ